MSTITDAATNARHIGEALSEAALASVKQNQELAGKTFEVWIGALGGLSATSPSELADNVTESVTAGFDLAKQALDGRRQIAQKLVAVCTGNSFSES